MAVQELRFPGVTVFEAGAIDRLNALLPPHVPLLVVAGRHAAGLIGERIIPRLGDRRYALAAAITPELPLADVEAALEAGRAIGAGAVAAIGGGSALDAGKTVAALLPHPALKLADCFYGRTPVTAKGAFFLAAPTTAGTGSEMTPNAVLLDPVTGIKQSIRHPAMLPDVALIDPELTYSCAPGVTAASGFDALTQAIESLISNRATAFTKSLAKQAIELIFTSLKGAYAGDRESRDRVAEGSMLGGMAFAHSGLGAVHGLAHPAGSLLHLAHGKVCATLLIPVLRRNAAALDRETGGRADAMIAELAQLRSELGLADRFGVELTVDQRRFILGNCRSGSMKCNPVALSDAELEALLGEVFR